MEGEKGEAGRLSCLFLCLGSISVSNDISCQIGAPSVVPGSAGQPPIVYLSTGRPWLLVCNKTTSSHYPSIPRAASGFLLLLIWGKWPLNSTITCILNLLHWIPTV
jgi:hypothetical protein